VIRTLERSALGYEPAATAVDRYEDAFDQAGGFLSFELPAAGGWFTRVAVCCVTDYGPEPAINTSSARHAVPKSPW
jgi:hypothetical protein